MNDTFNIPNLHEANQIFQYNGSTTWQTWNKPRNAKFVSFFVIGGGGGGGGGAAGSGVGRVGGAGGGSSSLTTGIFPAFAIPDMLHIQVGAGGIGGVSAGAGVAGGITYVSTYPGTARTNVVVSSGTTGAVAGNGGSTLTPAGGTIFSPANALISYNSLLNGLAGATGGAGSSTTGTAVTILRLPLSGGAGGGGSSSVNTNFAGGAINSYSYLEQIPGGAATGGAGAGGYCSPFHGIKKQDILLFTGGSGGGGNGAGTGGTGGNGAYGCGGGGGGAGTTSRGGFGGNGGNGLVIITTW
jgi:hypothetical protein